MASKAGLLETFRQAIANSTDRNFLLAVKYADLHELAASRLQELPKAKAASNAVGSAFLIRCYFVFCCEFFVVVWCITFIWRWCCVSSDLGWWIWIFSCLHAFDSWACLLCDVWHCPHVVAVCNCVPGSIVSLFQRHHLAIVPRLVFMHLLSHPCCVVLHLHRYPLLRCPSLESSQGRRCERRRPCQQCRASVRGT